MLTEDTVGAVPNVRRLAVAIADAVVTEKQSPVVWE